MKNIKKYKVNKNKKLRGGASSTSKSIVITKPTGYNSSSNRKVEEIFTELLNLQSFKDGISGSKTFTSENTKDLLNQVINLLLNNLGNQPTSQMSYSLVQSTFNVKKDNLEQLKQSIYLIRSSYDLYLKSVLILTGNFDSIKTYCIDFNQKQSNKMDAMYQKINKLIKEDIETYSDIPINIDKYMKCFLTNNQGASFPGIDGRFTNKDYIIKNRSTSNRINRTLILLTPIFNRSRTSNKSYNASRSADNFGISTNNFIATINIILNDIRSSINTFGFKKKNIIKNGATNIEQNYGIVSNYNISSEEWSQYFKVVSTILITILNELFKNNS